MYSKKAVGETNGPSKLQACVLDQWTEIGYACGNEVAVEGFYAHQELNWGETVEAYYYNPSVGKKGGILVTKGVCSVCYFDKNIVDIVESFTRPGVVGKNLLPLCRNFFI